MPDSKSFSALFALWQQADAIARAAEETVLGGSMSALDGDGTLPSEDDWKQAKRLRAQADNLLDQAIEQMREEDGRRGARKPPDGVGGGDDAG
jgi:hypothetical protein